MAISNVRISSVSRTQVFQAPALEEHAVTTMFFCNQSTTADTTLDLYVVPSGVASSNTGTQIIKSLSLPKTETFVFDAEKLILFDGDGIYAQASVDQVVIATVSTVKTS
jgi:hypothetical protein